MIFLFLVVNSISHIESGALMYINLDSPITHTELDVIIVGRTTVTFNDDIIMSLILCPQILQWYEKR